MNIFNNHISTKIILSLTILISAFAASAQAGTLENLERERARLVQIITDPNLNSSERFSQINSMKPRLVDLERQTIRDQSLKGKNNAHVRNAFKNYDLTFLAHAAIEKNSLIIDQWLNQFNINTQSIMATRVGLK